MGHHGINIGLAASSLVIPAVIASVVPASENAVYTTVRLATMFGFMVPYALSVSLFAASAADADINLGRSRRVLLASLMLSLALYGAMFVLADPILWLFGRDYAREGVDFLRVAAIAGPLMVLKDQYIAQARLSHQMGKALPFLVVSSTLEIGLAFAGALRWNLMGALVGWIFALVLQAIYLMPRLPWRDTSRRSASDVSSSTDPEVSERKSR
jgi:O-antigen/teichoic acid export membrane protein